MNPLPRLCLCSRVGLAGGRPETVDESNCQRFTATDGRPEARAIIEGANSFITPATLVALQRGGVGVMRDCSANKCGVLSSSMIYYADRGADFQGQI